ncbi:Uncharacterized protein APZ42_014399 [Daphnia magna]|uniref:Uncharacterized protein n=1 Tax=Daphnia magna TaxID=35525 RepID=A0A162PXI7_9CRUS|nr:Uncharacterized protein APZ42_014399 [Daphnia magna]
MLQAEYGLEPNDFSTDRDYMFLAKLTEHFQGKIFIMKHETKGIGKIIFSSTIPPTKAFAPIFNVNNGISYKVQEAAYFLRNLVLKSPCKPLPTNKLQAKDI